MFCQSTYPVGKIAEKRSEGVRFVNSKLKYSAMLLKIHSYRLLFAPGIRLKKVKLIFDTFIFGVSAI